MTETTSSSNTASVDYTPPPRSWLSRHSDWLMGFGATLFLLTMAVGFYFAFGRELPEDAHLSAFFKVLFAFMMGIFMYFAAACLIVFGFALHPRRRKANPCGVASTQIYRDASQSIVRRYALDDALGAVMFALVAGWFVWMLGLGAYGFAFGRAPTDLELALFCSVIILGALLIGRLFWLRWSSPVYAIRIDHKQHLIHPARRLFTREALTPIDIDLIKSIHAERWAARVRPDGRPAPNSCARMSITASVDDPNCDRHIHLLTTTDAERVGHWLAAYLGVPFIKQRFRRGPHRSFRVSKPLPDDIDS